MQLTKGLWSEQLTMPCEELTREGLWVRSSQAVGVDSLQKLAVSFRLTECVCFLCSLERQGSV